MRCRNARLGKREKSRARRPPRGSRSGSPSSMSTLPRAVAEARCAALFQQLLDTCTADECRNLYVKLKQCKFCKLRGDRLVEETARAATEVSVPPRVRLISSDALVAGITTLLHKKAVPIAALRKTIEAHALGNVPCDESCIIEQTSYSRNPGHYEQRLMSYRPCCTQTSYKRSSHRPSWLRVSLGIVWQHGARLASTVCWHVRQLHQAQEGCHFPEDAALPVAASGLPLLL